VRPEVAAKLDEVVMRALERDRESRWASAGEMLDALNRYLYSLDTTPGPRDLAAMVARYCPPETRRMPTHVEAAFEAVPAASDDAPPPAGPRTSVIPRDGAARGKAPRQQSFATHVELKDLLERATPLFPLTAITDDVAVPPTTVEPAPAEPDDDAPASRSMRARSVGKEPVEEHRDGPRMPPIGRIPPSQAVLVIFGIGGLVLAGIAIYVFLHGRAAVMRPDAAPKFDAPFYAADADMDGPIEIDAAIEPDATIADAATDAPRAPHDAVIAINHADARAVPAAIDAAIPRPTGKATLKIGADPWGEVVIDGAKQSKNTPIDVEVGAGHHVIDVIYRGVDPPLTKHFQVDVSDGESKTVTANFQP